MGLGLGDDVRFGHAVAGEGEAIAGIGIGADGGDMGDGILRLALNPHRGFYSAVAYFKRNNATLVPRISSPYDGPALFF